MDAPRWYGYVSNPGQLEQGTLARTSQYESQFLFGINSQVSSIEAIGAHSGCQLQMLPQLSSCAGFVSQGHFCSSTAATRSTGGDLGSDGISVDSNSTSSSREARMGYEHADDEQEDEQNRDAALQRVLRSSNAAEVRLAACRCVLLQFSITMPHVTNRSQIGKTLMP